MVIVGGELRLDSTLGFLTLDDVGVSSGFLGEEPVAAEASAPVLEPGAVVVVGVPTGGAGGGCGRGEVGSRITGLVIGGPRGVVLYKFPLGLRIPIELSLLRTTSTQSSITSRELQANLKSNKRHEQQFLQML